ncbi:DNA repair protein RadC [Macrococcoides caseolyticum]|uniref:JAB domain-containing protein n=1 Tax=Macrococcoides caseolyticum TaxID=69966 RepID=UPI000C339BF4|nr:JAB domain-containing protein [Macrococcus caseolyticus]PKE65705.1 DNA repair protein RadC [Macrococcus caseolyticus]
MHKKKINIVSIQMVKEKVMWYSERKVSSPENAAKIMREFVGSSDREVFIVLSLNTKNEPTHIEKVSVGSLNASIIHPREVFKSAILSNAANIILGHNHPSGHPQPSYEDIEATKRLYEVGKLIGIDVLDHIIFTDDSFISLKESGHL